MTKFQYGDELRCISDGGNVWLTVGKVYACKGVISDCCTGLRVYVRSDIGDMMHYNAEYFVLADDAEKQGEGSKGIADRLQAGRQRVGRMVTAYGKRLN